MINQMMKAYLKILLINLLNKIIKKSPKKHKN